MVQATVLFQMKFTSFWKDYICKHKCFNDVQHRILLQNFLTAEIRLKIWTRNFLVRARVIPMRGSNLDRCNEGNFFSSISLLSEMSFVYTDLSKLSFKTPLFKLFAALSKKKHFYAFFYISWTSTMRHETTKLRRFYLKMFSDKFFLKKYINVYFLLQKGLVGYLFCDM